MLPKPAKLIRYRQNLSRPLFFERAEHRLDVFFSVAVGLSYMEIWKCLTLSPPVTLQGPQAAENHGPAAFRRQKREPANAGGRNRAIGMPAVASLTNPADAGANAATPPLQRRHARGHDPNSAAHRAADPHDEPAAR